MKKINILFVILLIILIGEIVRVYPYLQYCPIKGYWDINREYPTLHILENGYLLKYGEIQTYDYSDGIYDELDDRTKNILNAMTCIVLGINKYDYFYYNRFYLILGLLYPICFIALYRLFVRYNKRGNEKIGHNNLYIIYLFSFSLFANHIIIFNTSYAILADMFGRVYTYLSLAFYSLIRLKDNQNYSLLFYLFAISILFVHHTSALYFISVLFAIIIFELITNYRIYRLPVIIIAIIISFVYYIYISKFFLEAFGSIILKKLTELPYIILLGKHKSILLDPYILKRSVWLIYIKFISIILSIILPVLYIILNKNIKYETKCMLIPWIIGAGIFAAGIYVWAGLYESVVRVTHYLFVISSTSLALILAHRKNLKRTYIIFLTFYLIVIAILSIFLHITTIFHYSDISYSEYSSITWLSSHTSKDVMIISDYRLATPFILSGHTKITGVANFYVSKYPLLLIEYLKAVYYGNDSLKAINYLNNIRLNGESFDYLFLSRNMAKEYIGIREVTYTYRPPPSNFLKKFDISENVNKIYYNNIGVIYRNIY